MEVLSGSREVGFFKIVNQNHEKSHYTDFPWGVTENTVYELTFLKIWSESVHKQKFRTSGKKIAGI